LNAQAEALGWMWMVNGRVGKIIDMKLPQLHVKEASDGLRTDITVPGRDT
jgi:hypothetical protein